MTTLVRDSDLVPGIASALNRRDVGALVNMASAAIHFSVDADPGVVATKNQRLWRGVRLSGQEPLKAYLGDLFMTLPSLTMSVEVEQGLPCWTTLLIEMAGVDADGAPFDSVGRFRVRSAGGKVTSIGGEILHVAIGADLLSDPDRNHRRFFESFLEDGSSRGPGAMPKSD